MRLALLASLGVLLAYLSLYTFASNAVRKIDPDLALTIAPSSSEAMSSVIEQRILGGGSSIDMRALAERSINRNPLNTAAWRALGLIEASNGNMDLAVRMLSFANYLSRRDNATNIWLVEQHLQHNELRLALEHYDYALRTSMTLREQLLPRLALATAERATIAPLVEVLLRSPPWAEDFFASLNNLAPDGANVAELVSLLRKGDYEGSLAILGDLPQRFADLGQLEPAANIYASLSDRRPAGVGTLAFVQDGPLPPFDWELTADGTFEASALSEGEGGGTLLVYAHPDQRRTAAKRLLRLAPGEYRLATARVAGPGAGRARMTWELTCYANGRTIGAIPLTIGNKPQAARFRVRADGCAAQWLALVVTTATGTKSSEIEVASPILRRVG